MKKILLISILFATLFNLTYSQELDYKDIESELNEEEEVVKTKDSKLFIGLNGSYTQSTINNKNVINSININSTPQFSINGSLEIGYYFTKNFGLSIAGGYSSYTADLKSIAYTYSCDAVDSEGDSFTMNVAGFGISEKQKLSFVDIPVSILINIPFTKKIGLYINPGVKFSVPISKSYEGAGIFSYSGYYSQWNITFSDLEQYGFPSDYETNKNADLDVAPFNTFVSGTAGFYFNIAEKFGIRVGFSYDYGLSNISKYDNSSYHISSEKDEYYSLMGSSEKTTLRAMGGVFSLRYYF